MTRLLVVAHLLGPTIFFYCVAYLLRHPQDWSGPVVMAVLSLVLTLLVQAIGLRAIQRTPAGPLRVRLITTQVAGPVGGLFIGVMLYFLMLPH
jgi:hypothetical protein